MNLTGMRRIFLVTLIALGAACTGGDIEPDRLAEDSLKNGFLSPPAEARPRVWWHWMNGNITREGIEKDLEWMHRIGIGGVQNFDAAMETPIVVDRRLVYMSPEWKQAFAFAVKKADELGLEFAIASSAGWSLTGGPWVEPEDAMKKFVWSEAHVAGGKTVSQALPVPPAAMGPYQTLEASYKHGHNKAAIPESFYRDVAVIAYPVTYPEHPELPRKVTANETSVEGEPLFDGDLATGIALPADDGKSPGAINLEYAQPQTIQSAVLYIRNPPSSVFAGALKPTLQALTPDGAWQSVAEIALGDVPTTVSFPPVTSQRFRLLLTRGKPGDYSRFALAPGLDPSGMGSLGAAPPAEPLVMDFRLENRPKIHGFEAKAGFSLVDNYHELAEPASSGLEGIDPTAVVNLTDKVTADGELAWDVPPGHWKVLRLGYSLTGKTNSPATDEATGLEVDKFDSAAVERYLNTYLDKYQRAVGNGLMGERGLEAILTDSTEAGPSNWTPAMVTQFRRLRGYDPTPWLPALTGEIVGSRAQSDGFLYDFRHTLAQLGATEHYGTLAGVAHKRGLTVYGESLEATREGATLGDGLEMRRFADIPMAAMWSYAEGQSPAPHYVADMRGAASVAHLYGKRFAAAESLTSIAFPWEHAPADLQPMIDAEFLSGINRPVIHTSVHQPVDEKVPGMSLHAFGQFFTRHETWAEMASPWMDYLSRNSYLLQQGHNVADVGYFYGEEPSIGVLVKSRGYPEDVPRRYAYDFIPPDVVLNEFSVDGGDLVTRGGARFKVLYLGGTSRDFMTLPVLKRMAELVEQGATLVGQAPHASPSLGDDKKAFTALVERLWRAKGVTRMGDGRVIASSNVEEALAEIDATADFKVDGEHPVHFVHRRLSDGDIYFVANRGEALQVDAHFRVTGKAPEIWRADTGAIEPASYQLKDSTTVVPLAMADWESFFLVFREPATGTSRTVEKPVFTPQVTIDGPWEVSFQKGRGAPDEAVFETLDSLSRHEDLGIRYFSGVTAYRNTFSLPAGDGTWQALQLDLGEVGDVAEVYVNGHYAGTAWKPPYRVAIGEHIGDGANQLEIRVANRWVNRLIGDRQPDAKPVTYTTFNTYLPTAPLRPSGLIGPVKILVEHQ